jgi:ketosteroid isomerase-like protein
MAVVSREQRERLARAGFEVFNSGNPGSVVELLTEDVEIFSSPELANPGTFRGRDGYLAWIGPWADAWEGLDMEVGDVTPVGDRHVIAEVHQVGHGRSGIEVSMDVAFLFEVSDDDLVDFLALLPDGEQATALAKEREA